MKRTILTTAAFAAVILLVPAANAADTTWRYVVISEETVWDGNWDDANHWTSGVPSSTETAELPTSSGTPYTVTVNTASEACETLTMHSDATLDVSTGDQLQIGNTDGQFSTINGTIKLSTNTSVLQFVNSHTVAGGGVIDGQDNGALIKITTGKTLTNAMTIEGNCQIVPVGGASTTFTNQGVVHANTAGTLAVTPDSIGVSCGVWQVSNSASAILQIGAPSAGAHCSSVNVSNGTLDVNYDFEIECQLTFTGGTIDVASTKTFEAS